MHVRTIKTKIDTIVHTYMVKVVTRLDRMYQDWFFKKQEWPVVSGRYYIGKKDSSVAVCTLGSIDLMKKIGSRDEIAIVGKTYTENLGIEKMIKNVVSNPSIRLLVLCGKESPHKVGQSVIALKQNGVDDKGRIVGSKGMLPILKNIGRSTIERFQNQIEIIDLIGEEQKDEVMKVVAEARKRNLGVYEGSTASVSAEDTKEIERIDCWYKESLDYEPDPAGFFLIQIDRKSKEILAEHYSNSHEIQRVLHAKSAIKIYSTIIRNNWVTVIGHAAYLGRELAKAELALRRGLMYEQNKELTDL